MAALREGTPLAGPNTALLLDEGSDLWRVLQFLYINALQVVKTCVSMTVKLV